MPSGSEVGTQVESASGRAPQDGMNLGAAAFNSQTATEFPPAAQPAPLSGIQKFEAQLAEHLQKRMLHFDANSANPANSVNLHKFWKSHPGLDEKQLRDVYEADVRDINDRKLQAAKEIENPANVKAAAALPLAIKNNTAAVPSPDVTAWSVDDVCNWALDTVDLPNPEVGALRREKIRGRVCTTHNRAALQARGELPHLLGSWPQELLKLTPEDIKEFEHHFPLGPRKVRSP